MLESLAALGLVAVVSFVAGRRHRQGRSAKPTFALGRDIRCAAGKHDPVKDDDVPERLISIPGAGLAMVSECWCIRCGARFRASSAVPDEESLDRAAVIREKLRAAEGNGRAVIGARGGE